MSEIEKNRIAILMYNLGGPDSPKTVRPFLQNLFSDPAILRVPKPIRWALARLIAYRRAEKAIGIYNQIGGRSPLFENTKRQAQALLDNLINRIGKRYEIKCFIVMRYWHPMSFDVVAEVKSFQPHKIIELPLYPQLSTTTSMSSFNDWKHAARSRGLSAPAVKLCCYSENTGFIEASALLLAEALTEQRQRGFEQQRILFSAHGLPESIVAQGDPYQWQVEQTAAAIAKKLKLDSDRWFVCYQSRVGPLKWIGPATEAEIERAGKDNHAIVLYPLAFVSEHSETLVELDIEYRHLAKEAGVPDYSRVKTVSDHPKFIDGLADLVVNALATEDEFFSANVNHECPRRFTGCPRNNQPG